MSQPLHTFRADHTYGYKAKLLFSNLKFIVILFWRLDWQYGFGHSKDTRSDKFSKGEGKRDLGRNS